MDLHLRDKVALVTGGVRGLGRAISLALAAEGAKVAVNYRPYSAQGQNRKAEAEELCREIAAEYGVIAAAVAGDVTCQEEVVALFDQAAAALGPVEILVNNAGVWPKAYVQDITLEEWNDTVAANLTGPFLTCREAVRRWLPTGCKGRIVNVASQAAFHGSTTGHAHYASAKGGLVIFTVSLAREVAPKGIAVNAIAPGMMTTDMTRGVFEDDLDHYLARIPMGRVADPAEMAAVVAFLCSDKASYMTGATVDVSGGMLMR